MTSIIFRVLAFLAAWWILAEGRLDGGLLAGLAIAAATWVSLKLYPPKRWNIRALGLSRFVCFFIWNSFQGGLQVAMMALKGRSTLQPAMIEIPINLPQGGARILLVNTVGLMPGTLSVDLDHDFLHIHVLDERQPIVAEIRALEASIAAMFGDVL